MYITKKDFVFPTKINKKAFANEVGLRYESLLRIIHGKQQCQKTTAYSISKHINENSEINNYFEVI